MTRIHERIETGYRITRDPERRPILKSAFELLIAAAEADQPLTLNPVQAKALAAWVDGQQAAQELRATLAPATPSPSAPQPRTPSNIIPFRRA